MHLLSRLSDDELPGAIEGEPRLEFMNDEGSPCGYSIQEFGQRIGRNFEYLDASFEVTTLVYYGLGKLLKLVEPVFGNGETPDSYKVTDIMEKTVHDAADHVHDPNAVYFYYINGNHYMPFVPLIQTGLRHELGNFKIPRTPFTLRYDEFEYGVAADGRGQ
jgi:hypothetical protein